MRGETLYAFQFSNYTLIFKLTDLSKINELVCLNNYLTKCVLRFWNFENSAMNCNFAVIAFR
jgi:hypothetical protein